MNVEINKLYRQKKKKIEREFIVTKNSTTASNASIHIIL